MGIMDLLGRKRENQAMAFVDYEHWFFSLREKFGVKPDVLAWAKEVRDQYDISQMLFVLRKLPPGHPPGRGHQGPHCDQRHR